MIYTGIGYPLDDLVDILGDLALAGIEAVLNVVALALSFVVVPVEIKVAGQETRLEFRRFDTNVYQHPGAPGSDFLAIDMDARAE